MNKRRLFEAMLAEGMFPGDDVQLTMPYEELTCVRVALLRLQAKFEEAPTEDWRASLAWEGIEEVLTCLDSAMFDACAVRYKPSDFRHWRNKYITDDDKLPF